MEWPLIYQSCPLHPTEEGGPYIRVTHLRPGKGQEPLCCELEIVRIRDENTRYEALSYTWGDETQYSVVQINGVERPIGKNLTQALLSIRKPDETMTLWVDVLCVNQVDIPERTSQVRIMHQVYIGAYNVLVWLTQPSTPAKLWHPRRAFRLAEQLYRISLQNPDTDLRNTSFSTKLATFHKSGLLEQLPNKDSLRHIFSSPWFERMWVVQEVSCAKQATLVCGNASIPFDHFVEGVRFGLERKLFRTSGNRWILDLNVQYNPGNISAMISMYTIKTRTEKSNDTLMNYLTRFFGSQCKDPRDKIFALNGISELEAESKLAESFADDALLPDYEMDVRTLYTNVAKACLRTGSLDILSRPCVYTSSNCKDFPTWVPDWTILKTSQTFASLAATRQYDTSRKQIAKPLIIDDKRCLLRGHIVDVIQEIGDRGYPSMLKNSPVTPRPGLIVLMFAQRWLDRVILWERKYHNINAKYRNGEDLTDVYCSIFLAARLSYESQWFQPGMQTESSVSEEELRASAKIAIKPVRENEAGLAGLMNTLKSFWEGVKWQPILRSGPHDDQFILERNIMISKQGYLGICPWNAFPGDKIVILEGGSVPFILRSTGGDDGTYFLLGDAYVHGIMQGEAFKAEECHDIVLV